MATSRNKTIHLSKNLSQMKFMQRRSRRDAEDEVESEKQRQIDDTHWVLDLPDLTSKGNRYNTVDSASECLELVYGRMSFNGMNPAIERIMGNLQNEQGGEEEDEEDRAQNISDNEMTNRYSSLVGTIGKKFSKKRNRSHAGEGAPEKKHKKSFLKPPDE